MRRHHRNLSLVLSIPLALACGLAACQEVGQSSDYNSELRPAADEQPIQALYVTNYSSYWHKYREQQEILRRGLSQHVNVEVTLVGKDEDDVLTMIQQPNFAAGYDVVIYNMCLVDESNPTRIDNVIRQTRDLGIPSVLIHCAMHSFKYSDSWWRFTGLKSESHDWGRSVFAQKHDTSHPIAATLPEWIDSPHDEIYRNIQVAEGVVPLYSAFSLESQDDHVVAWTHRVGEGEVFATTLGHDKNTLNVESFQRLVANGIAYVTGRLEENGELKEHAKGNKLFDNYQTTVTCQPSDIIEASNLDEVKAGVLRAVYEEKHLKVVSLDKSNSDNPSICPEQGGLLLNLWQMNKIFSIDPAGQTVTVQPGIRVDDLGRYLHQEGFALATMPDYTGVSVAGAIATAAHHSSLRIASSMADLVESIRLVDGEGKIRFFEGEDAAKAAAHLGVLGVVVEVTLRIEPQFKLQYGHEKGSDAGLEETIAQKVAAHDYARVMWFAGNQRYVMDYYDRVANETSGTSEHNLWTSSGSVFRIVGDIPYKILNNAPLRAQCDSALLRSKFWLAPIKAVDSPGNKPVGWSHQMLGSYCLPGTCPWDTETVKSRTQEAAFALSDLGAWMQDVRAILDRNRACFPVLGLYLRFSKASDRWLGFNQGQETVAFEIHVPKVVAETAFERSAAVYNEIMQMTLQKYNGRPHWGKNSVPEFEGVGPKQYPRWNDFMQLKNTLDPKGRFNNKFWRRMRGQEKARHYPGCALSRDCICKQDSDCGTGYQCVPGDHFTAARVCR